MLSLDEALSFKLPREEEPRGLAPKGEHASTVLTGSKMVFCGPATTAVPHSVPGTHSLFFSRE